MKNKETYYPIKIPKTAKIGDRYKILIKHEYYDISFDIGHYVTFVELTEPRDFGHAFYIFPMFKFDGDNKNRTLEFHDLERV